MGISLSNAAGLCIRGLIGVSSDIEVIDVALAGYHCHHWNVVAKLVLDFPFHAPWPVGGNHTPADGVAMIGDVGHKETEPSILPDCQDWDFRVDSAFRCDNIRIQLAGVGDNRPVLHPKAPVECQSRTAAFAKKKLRFSQIAVGALQGKDCLGYQLLQVFLVAKV